MSENASYDEVGELRRQVAELGAKNNRLAEALKVARTRLTQLQNQFDTTLKPPAQVGFFIRELRGRAEVVLSGRHLQVGVHPSIKLKHLKPGQRVLLDQSSVLVGTTPEFSGGEVVGVVEIVDDSRILVRNANTSTSVLLAGPQLQVETLQPGDSVIADIRAGFALEKLVRRDVEQLLSPQLPNVAWEDIGGLKIAIEQVKDAVELPFSRPELYRQYGLRPPRGILLFGPPGCGKTLLAKAVATSLGSADKASYFLSVKGPELLNKFVGETERQIRAIFARARQLAQDDIPVVIFFDEMEALFRTRGTGVSSDVETTVVPQLLAEIDGVESLDNVIVIGASNREDMIDPAVLRPGRLDVRVHIGRPDEDDAAHILRLNLPPDIPLSARLLESCGSVEAGLERLVELIVGLLYQRKADTAIADITYTDGSTNRLYLADMVSGAMLAGIVERAKTGAIKAGIQGSSQGLSEELVRCAIAQEVATSIQIMSTVNPREWAKINGAPASEIASLRPVKPPVPGDSCLV